MLRRHFVQTLVMRQRPDLTVEQIDWLIDDAVRMLGNLVHYKHNGSHEDEDVAAAVLVIGQDVQVKS